MNFSKLDVVDYFDNAKVTCGVIMEVEDNRLKLLNDLGKDVKISANRALTCGRDKLFTEKSTRTELLSRLKEINAIRESIKTQIDLKELWEVIGQEESEFNIHDLADLVFGSNNDTNSESALLRAIFEDKTYFKSKPGVIEVMSPEQVEQEISRRLKELERKRTVASYADFLNKVRDSLPVDADEVPKSLIHTLESAAYLGREWNTVKKVRDIFNQAGLNGTWDPFRVLVALGVWSPDENIRLRAEAVPVDFPPEIISEAERAAKRPLPDDSKNFCDQDVVSIDSSHTRDVDDAISLSHEGDDILVGIHITDASHFVDKDSELEKDIRQRATSIYFPDRLIPMMPTVLSESSASLIHGEKRPAISVVTRFGHDLKIKNYEIFKSIVRVSETLTYGEVDNRVRIHGSKESRLLQLALALREQRLAAGALIFRDPELSVHVDSEGAIDVYVRDRENPSQILVSEFMIMANSMFASFLKERNIPAIYRSQPPPLEHVQLEEQYDPVVSYRSKKVLARGTLGLNPEPHSSLGLPVYITATSPLRRYTDLLMQRQIKAALNNQAPPLDYEQLDLTLSEISYRLDRAAILERERLRYYFLKYLSQLKDEEFELVVLHRFPRFYLAQITKFGFNAALLTGSGNNLSPYDKVVGRIEKVNPRADRLTMTLVRRL